MLVLKNIRKEYDTAGESVTALKGIDLAFRRNEFVSILGHSGCGKTTLLNVIGGLDRYSSGDLLIRGVSTSSYSESDWDTYRNHSIGFVFQSYNLIPHQTVLSNVELALTLSGVSKSERRARAIAVLKKVGLGDQIYKKPNQMSGGQMQRVAIARALINDPEILLADEPTGALDTDTSVQIMELLKEISGDRLIIMVTHNPELAEKYSDRIIRLRDGEVVGDTSPFSIEEEAAETEKLLKQASTNKGNKTSMSFFTALSLSLNNLMTKKGRTFMTAFAGSIGIIGIALILSLSSGIKNYINKVQQDTLSSYPIQIEAETMDISGLISSIMGSAGDAQEKHEDGKIYSSTVLYDLITTMNNSAVTTNDLQKFKEYLESDACNVMDYATYIQYGYDLSINAYLKDDGGEYFKADISSLFSGMMSEYTTQSSYLSMSNSFVNYSVWEEMLSGEGENEYVSPIIKSQYGLVAGKWPESYNEVVLLISDNNEISDITLYTLGLISSDEMLDTMIAAMKETGDVKHESKEYEYSDILGISYQLIASTEYFSQKNGVWYDISTSSDNTEFKSVVANAATVKIVGIIKKDPEATAATLSGSLIYTKALTDYLLGIIENSEVVKAQKANETVDIFTGLPFVLNDADKLVDPEKPHAFLDYVSTLPNDQKAELFTKLMTTPTDEYVTATSEYMLASYGIKPDTEYEVMLNTVINVLGGTDEDKLLVRKWLSTYTQEELYEYIVDTFGKYISDQYTESAMQKIESIKNTPDANELTAEKAIIYFSLLDGIEQKRTYVKALANELMNTNSAFYPFAEKLAKNADSMTEAELESELGALFRQAANYNGVIDNAARILISLMDNGKKKAYIVNQYTSSTAIPEANVTEWLDGLEYDEMNSVFNGLVTANAQSSYSAISASSQTGEKSNKKLSDAFDAFLQGCTDEQLVYYYDEYMELVSKSSLKENYELIGYADKNDPKSITIYAADFESKEDIADIITKYNSSVDEEDRISYTDYVALLMSSITTIIDAISYVLIAFVSISLVVSSIMIGIITYISVLERTKEIGILRSIGASRRDISRVFNAETLIVGFVAGAIGILVTLLLNIPINIIIKALTGVSGISSLPAIGAFGLIAISMLLTFFAGLVPASVASKKDPVVALRTE